MVDTPQILVDGSDVLGDVDFCQIEIRRIGRVRLNIADIDACSAIAGFRIDGLVGGEGDRIVARNRHQIAADGGLADDGGLVEGLVLRPLPLLAGVDRFTRSDEQLAYYVAQAREVVDLSLLSQKQVMEELQQLAARRGKAGSA